MKCSFEKRCGNGLQNENCNLIEISELTDLVKEETAKIQGCAIQLHV